MTYYFRHKRDLVYKLVNTNLYWYEKGWNKSSFHYTYYQVKTNPNIVEITEEEMILELI